jgi:DNA polymerase V
MPARAQCHLAAAPAQCRHARADQRRRAALRGIYRPGFNYAKAGVMLVDLQPQAQQQDTPDLFDELAPAASHRRDGLMSALDSVNQRFGRHALTVASAAPGLPRGVPAAHASRQQRRSPRYTTRLDEIATLRA